MRRCSDGKVLLFALLNYAVLNVEEMWLMGKIEI
jgi:hypothetical protein